MARERMTFVNKEEADLFRGLYWDDWKHSMLDRLNIEHFKDKSEEKLLHSWWFLRMQLRYQFIGREIFDEERKKLFLDVEYEDGSVVDRCVRYITEKLSDNTGSTRRN